jgi:hypothetical protein
MMQVGRPFWLGWRPILKLDTLTRRSDDERGRIAAPVVIHA